MILPSKHLSQDRALLTIGGKVLTFLVRPKTVSAIWEELNGSAIEPGAGVPLHITYDWFLLALAFLYALGAIELDSGLVARSTV